MKNLLNFISFLFESEEKRMRLPYNAPFIIKMDFLAHAKYRMSYRDDDNEQARWRKITRGETEEVISYAKKAMLTISRKYKPNPNAQSKNPEDWQFSIKVTGDRFGYLLSTANFMVSITEDFKSKSWIASLKTFKFEEGWTDRPTDWIIEMNDESLVIEPPRSRRTRIEIGVDPEMEGVEFTYDEYDKVSHYEIYELLN